MVLPGWSKGAGSGLGRVREMLGGNGDEGHTIAAASAIVRFLSVNSVQHQPKAANTARRICFRNLWLVGLSCTARVPELRCKPDALTAELTAQAVSILQVDIFKFHPKTAKCPKTVQKKFYLLADGNHPSSSHGAVYFADFPGLSCTGWYRVAH